MIGERRNRFHRIAAEWQRHRMRRGRKMLWYIRKVLAGRLEREVDQGVIYVSSERPGGADVSDEWGAFCAQPRQHPLNAQDEEDFDHEFEEYFSKLKISATSA